MNQTDVLFIRETRRKKSDLNFNFNASQGLCVFNMDNNKNSNKVPLYGRDVILDRQGSELQKKT